jgi:acyl-homoserine-lactone acylase
MVKLKLLAAALAATLALASCATRPDSPEARTVTIQRTAHGVAHFTAPNARTLAYGVAYAHAQDNVCQTADQLVTVRGERSRYFGAAGATGLLGRRVLPNDVIDIFVRAHMDDALLAARWAATSAEAQALAVGYVEGYNRYLTDHASQSQLPAACSAKPWVQAMTLAEYRRLTELLLVQASSAALADAIVRAVPPLPPVARHREVSVADAADALRDIGLLDSPLGSNAWAFGKDSTANGSGLLLGNPHFPWAGVNRFWQMHLTIPGELDVMGVGLGHGALVQIGFNRDVAWSHTVSTGKRFTLRELTLVAGDPTRYLLDGQPVKMTSRDVSISVRAADGSLSERKQTLWSSRWGPVVVMPAAGLNWSATTAYALQDAAAGNARSADTWLAMGRATNVESLRSSMGNLGLAFVNTLAVDRAGQALYADLSVVPDVDAAQLERCAPSKPVAALFKAAGLVVLDGSRSACEWRQDAASPVPGLTPPTRLPSAIRTDWFHNSNDSFFYSHPAQSFGNISPLVGDASVSRPRTRAGLTEIPDLLAQGKLTPDAVQRRLFENRNFMASVVLPDLKLACSANTGASAALTDGCAALAAWDGRNNLESRGAHLFREFWRAARVIPGVHRNPFDAAQPAATPNGLKMADAQLSSKVWQALEQAVGRVRTAGFALDATLGSVQHPLITDEKIALHGGDEFEGVLNNLGNQFAPGITPQGLRIDYGTSYVQTVSFDARGPKAQAILVYGQSTDPRSPHATDQLRLFSNKQWPELPFHVDDVAKARVGDVLMLTRP